MARRLVEEALNALEARWREGVVTDNGNIILTFTATYDRWQASRARNQRYYWRSL